MADGGPSFRPEDFSLGEGLERLLDILAREGLVIGARERTAAHLLAVQEMESAGVADRAMMAPANQRALMARLGPVLAPLLARTREERERYFRVMDQLYPPEVKVSPETGGGSAGDRIEPRKPWLLRHWGKLAGAGLALLLAVAAFIVLRPEPQPLPLAPGPTGVSTTEITGSVASSATPQQVEDSTPQTSDRLLTRVMAAAETHEGAPTLREIARRVSEDEESLARLDAVGTDPGWTAETYSQRLAELTGLPQDRPLPLYGRAGDNSPGLLWARLAQGLGRIEQPGREPPLSQLEAEAGTALAGAPRPRAYRVLDQLPRVFQDPSLLSGRDTTPAMLPGEIAKQLIDADAALDDARRIGEGQGEDIARALAMAGYPTVGFEHLPWIAGSTRPASTPPPAWLPWAALALPLLAALWFARSLFLMRPYLRRRPPRIPPTHTELVSEAGKRANVDGGYFQRVAQRLRVRTSRPSTEIDVAATIAATLKSGGVMIEPVQANARARPDYLVLVERMAAGDHDAMRMQRLIERLSELVDLDIYAFQYDPGEIEPWGGGRRIGLEEAQARHPDHRLIVLGTGIGLLDPVTHLPREAARKLMYWPRRVLLTPVPLAEWGREEYALAEGLAMPVGRATAEGLQFLAELLGLEGGEAEAQPDPRGDGLARPLPDLLRHRPQRFLFNNPPDNATVSRLVVELHNALTPAEFDWFAALAIYPSIQWDLTLFLGVYLPLRETDAVVIDPPAAPPERQKLQAPAEPLYGESRLAAISQLPWLRAGRMPNWLRTVLIRELSPKRAAQVRVVLQKALESSRLRDAATREEEAVFRIAEDRVRNEPRKEALPPEKVFDDDVLLDFLAGSQRTDFVLPRVPKIDGRFLRSFWQQLGGPGGLAGLAAIAFAASAFVVAPRGPHPVLTGAYGPLLMLLAGAVLAAALWRPAALGRNMAGWLERLAPGVFAIGLATLAVGGAFATPIGERLLDALAPAQSVLNEAPERGWPAAAIMMLALTGAAIAGLLLARWLGERLALRIHASPLGTLRQGLVLTGKALVLGAASYLLLQGGAAVLPAGTAFAAGLAPLMLAAAGVLASRFAPDSDTIARATAREERGTGLLPAGLRIALAALPLAAALGLFASISLSHSRTQLLAGADTGAPAVRPERVAIAGDGGAIVAVEASGRMVLSRADGAFIGVANAEAPLTALAIGGVTEARRVAYADASGRVFIWPAGGSPMPVEVDGAPLQSRGAPAQLAFGQDGMLLAATESPGTDGGAATRLTLGDRALAVGDLGAPPAALTWLDAGSWALATLDGGVFVLDRAATDIALSRLARSPETDTQPPVRLLSFAGASGLRAITTEGVVLEATSTDQRWSPLVPAGFNRALALGPSVGWDEAAPAARAALPSPDSRCVGLSQQFVVYFEWDRSDLTSQAMAVIEQAVANVPSGDCMIRQVTVEGHTDSSENPEAVSARRAKAVEQALISLGVNGDVITTQARGESDPAKPTADAVREPLNRRVGVTILVGTGEAAAISPPQQRPSIQTGSIAAPEEQNLSPGMIFRDRIARSPQTPVPEMVVLPAGNFMMGSPENEEGRSDREGPQRRVTVPAFAAGKFEVTWQEYQACAEVRGGCKTARDDGFGGGTRPVTNVSWEDAQAYVDWLSRETGKAYRLLSEAEWEYAARAGNSGRWSFGDGEGSLGTHAWYSDNSAETTHPVGTKEPNPFGLHDMHGNVYEWVEDCYETNYRARQPSNGRAHSPASCSDRVIRGGSWGSSPQYLRSANRDGIEPSDRDSSLGFRVARTLSSTP